MANPGKDSDKGRVPPAHSARSDEEAIESHVRSLAHSERLAPEEETFHTQRFYDSRNNLGTLLSHFPILISRKIRECKTTQIQEFDETGQLDQSLIDEKKQHIVSVISGLETVAEPVNGVGHAPVDLDDGVRQFGCGGFPGQQRQADNAKQLESHLYI